ncbi:MAG: GntR family transcriptional regulator [Acetanaerobacterium sp.]
MNTILTSEQSIYIQIAKKIEDDILRGILAENEGVPSTNQLAALYQINPATAAKGINLLVDADILYKKRGIGMFVTDGAKKTIIAARKTSFYERFIVTLVHEAKQLGIGAQELLEMITRASTLE